MNDTDGCFPKLTRTWETFLSVLQDGHKIHPANPTVPQDSEFIVIDRKVRIRVLHSCPNNTNRLSNGFSLNGFSTRSSLSDEYWFMKWNKPLKICDVNCTCRRSKRFSVCSNQTVAPTEKNSLSTLSPLDDSSKTSTFSMFVEKLVQETYLEALQEFYILKTMGKVNLAFEPTDDVPVLRKPKPNVITTPPSKSISNNSVSGGITKCISKNNRIKPLIMFIHGIGLSADIWSSVISTLVSKGYEVIAPDLLGHGFSSAPSKDTYYTFGNLLFYLLTIFDHYMIDAKRKSVLIGHSYGCSLATAMYPLRAEQISQLVLISGGGPTPLARPVKEREIPPFGCIYTMLHPLFYCGLKRSFFYSSRGKHFKSCDQNSGLPNNVLEHIINGQKWSEGDAAFHRRILVPTLLVHGLQDEHITLVQECEMERTIPKAFLELIPNAGHMAMIEAPEHLIRMISCFIDIWN